MAGSIDSSGRSEAYPSETCSSIGSTNCPEFQNRRFAEDATRLFSPQCVDLRAYYVASSTASILEPF
jgi:hypothetical protein